jgi:hypothetical protein
MSEYSDCKRESEVPEYVGKVERDEREEDMVMEGIMVACGLSNHVL